MKTATKTPKKKARIAGRIPPSMQRLFCEAETLRLEINELNRKKAALLKKLPGILEEAGIDETTFRGTVKGTRYIVKASIESPEISWIDTDKLKELVDEDIYNQCLVPQIGLIESLAGEVVVNKCRKYGVGDPKLVVTLEALEERE